MVGCIKIKATIAIWNLDRYVNYLHYFVTYCILKIILCIIQKLPFLITIYNNNPYKDLRSQLADLQADLNAYLGRGSRNAISDRMKFKILTSLTKNHLTVRQIESEIGDMIENVEYFQKFPKISRNPIHKVSYAIPS